MSQQITLQQIEAELAALKPMSIQELDAQLSQNQLELDQMKPSMDKLMEIEKKKGYFLALRDVQLHNNKRDQLLKLKSDFIAQEQDRLKKEQEEKAIKEAIPTAEEFQNHIEG